MHAMSESLALKRAQEQHENQATFHFHCSSAGIWGRIHTQPQLQRTKGTSFSLLDLLFVDDSALIATTHVDLAADAAELHNNF